MVCIVGPLILISYFANFSLFRICFVCFVTLCIALFNICFVRCCMVMSMVAPLPWACFALLLRWCESIFYIELLLFSFRVVVCVMCK